MTQFDKEYKKLLVRILGYGQEIEGRNGATIQIPSYSFTIDDMEIDYKLTMRKMFYAGVMGEFKTLVDPTPLRNVKQFEANGCNYWKKWSEEDGYLNVDYHNMLHPRLENVVKDIKENPNSRRHVINLWNQKHVDAKHLDLGALSLPCCWHGLTFTIQDGTIHLVWVQRSVDTAIGLPSDVYLANLFMRHIADRTGLNIGSCMFALSNVHVYAEHIEGIDKLLSLKEQDYGINIKFELKA